MPDSVKLPPISLGMVDFPHQDYKWDLRYLALAKFYAQWSKDPSTKVGAVLVKNNRVVGIGYNGFPPGVADTKERLETRELKYKFVVHAEVNAILSASREDAKGATLYVWPSFALPPICSECMKVAAVAGIKEIVGFEADANDERAQRWLESIKVSRQMCDEIGITYRGLPISWDIENG